MGSRKWSFRRLNHRIVLRRSQPRDDGLESIVRLLMQLACLAHSQEGDDVIFRFSFLFFSFSGDRMAWMPRDQGPDGRHIETWFLSHGLTEKLFFRKELMLLNFFDVSVGKVEMDNPA